MPTRHVKKKRQREKMHTQRRYATHPQGVSKKREREKKKIQPIPKTLQGKENSYKGVLIHHPPKISTHLHILIKAYDLFLLWIRSLTQRNMRSRSAVISSIPTDPPKRNHQKQNGERKTHKKALVRNETLLSDPRDHPRNLQSSFQKLYETSGLTVEQRSGKWYSTSCSDLQPPKMRMML